MTDHEELSRAFRERIEENYEDFKAEWENATPEEFFTDADIIAVTRFVHDECLDFVRDDQMEYLLGFQNPLEILRDYLMSEAIPSLDEVHHAFQTAVDSEDVPHFYQRIDSGPSMEQGGEIMAAVTIATVGKKALEVLASNKKGRKLLGYTVGIAIFILLIPVITLVGLFGWMAGDGSNTIDINAAKQGAVHGIGAYYSTYDSQLAEIESTFTACGLTEQDIKKADFIFVSLLTDHSDDEGFYEKYAQCFTDTSGKYSVYALISDAFGVTFSDEDKIRLDSTYGETPIRKDY